MIASARYINRKDPFKAYDHLLSAVEVNPNSIKLLKAFIYQCANIQQNTSGEYALEKLKDLVSISEYSTVQSTYDELVRSRSELDF